MLIGVIFCLRPDDASAGAPPPLDDGRARPRAGAAQRNPTLSTVEMAGGAALDPPYVCWWTVGARWWRINAAAGIVAYWRHGPSCKRTAAAVPSTGAAFGRAAVRVATVERNTKETRIKGRVDLDGTGAVEIATGIGFLDHMLEQLARHSLIDITLAGQGRPAHRFPPHHRGYRLRRRRGGVEGAGRPRRHPALRPAR